MRVWNFANVNLLSRFAEEVIVTRICNKFSWYMNTDSHLARSVHIIPPFVWFHFSFVPSGGFLARFHHQHTHTEHRLCLLVKNTKYCVYFREIFLDCRKFRRKFTELKYVGSCVLKFRLRRM